MSWWAFTFPQDALSLAMLQYAHLRPSDLVTVSAASVLALTSLVVAVVLARTVRAAATRHLFVPE